jgi:hypothetical protein
MCYEFINTSELQFIECKWNVFITVDLLVIMVLNNDVSTAIEWDEMMIVNGV